MSSHIYTEACYVHVMLSIVDLTLDSLDYTARGPQATTEVLLADTFVEVWIRARTVTLNCSTHDSFDIVYTVVLLLTDSTGDGIRS
jgi:hypothetical protein